ncbi:50S ribosomal protein L19e [archaeon]|nr:50S ribosomal protein L19e [archaeon]
MKLDQLKALASRTKKVGKNRIEITDEEAAAEAITREDVRELLKNKQIKIKKKQGVSTARAKIKKIKQQKGQRRGPGKRKGTRKTRTKKKETWMKKVRAQRKKLKEEQLASPEDYRKTYRMVKAGYFKDVKHLTAYIKAKRGKQ